ncbi:MAG: CPBP family intramembrane metalloprotease [Marinifilaceae bacterium]|jgi:membrane protease YdiL (CAAX protease family)|nr:CPBP family intramembrane metalloprotease [Marinifilaceae bacterium]
MTKKSFIRISIFYLIGISLSNIFRLDILNIVKPNKELTAIEILLTSPLGAVGLLIGALISMSLLKKERKLSYSLSGTSSKWSLIMMLIPIALLGIFGVHNSNNINEHLFGIIGGIATLIYAFSEEIGWRGYLQDELKEIKEWKRVVLIGSLWYLWHLSFLTNADLLANLQFLGWMIFGSWGIGKIIDSTKSIIAASCFHMIINIMMFNGLLTEGISGTNKLIILGASVAIWIAILMIWTKREKTIAD